MLFYQVVVIYMYVAPFIEYSELNVDNYIPSLLFSCQSVERIYIYFNIMRIISYIITYMSDIQGFNYVSVARIWHHNVRAVNTSCTIRYAMHI